MSVRIGLRMVRSSIDVYAVFVKGSLKPCCDAVLCPSHGQDLGLKQCL